MATPWDDVLKLLVQASPQAFVELFAPGARFIRAYREKLRPWKLEVDSLLEAALDGERMLIQLELQTYNDSKMPERLLRYNVLARSQYKIPVLSSVIFLLDDGPIRPSPLRWQVPPGYEILQFHFLTLRMADLSPDDLLGSGQPGLFPLLPLTKGGASREVVQEMFR